MNPVEQLQNALDKSGIFEELIRQGTFQATAGFTLWGSAVLVLLVVAWRLWEWRRQLGDDDTWQSPMVLGCLIFAGLFTMMAMAYAIDVYQYHHYPRAAVVQTLFSRGR